ncbi:hypothetical protein [Shouchella patagoniensis]|uniref:hypothetical protein n=1 Tax=Shouchella patagoniensis TaxID=228576 RepID=UPI000994ADE3|nr:hypothetical protein [Shouchella patagoniensis]
MVEIKERNGLIFINGIERPIKKIHRSAEFVEVEGTIIAKRCGCLSCNKMLPIECFGSDRRGLGRKRGWCKQCDYKRKKMNKIGLNVYGNPKKKKPINAFRVYEGGKCIRKRCTFCEEIKDSSQFSYHLKTVDSLTTICKVCSGEYSRSSYEINREHYQMMQAVRRARIAVLPDEVSEKEYRQVVESVFNGKCALTGEVADLSVDHAIPFSVGHVGSTLYNMYPLNRRLNSSKFSANIFEWVKRPHVMPLICSERFDKLIRYLASQAGLTMKDYREFTYWCFENPRTIDEVKASGDVDSLFLWDQSKNGQHTPLYIT